MVVYKKAQILWKTITGMDRPPQNRDEDFSALHTEIMKVDVVDACITSDSSDDIKTLMTAYIPEEAKNGVANRHGEAMAVDLDKERGSEIIRDIKNENREASRGIRHEHILVERIHAKRSHIVLVGPTGSGKSYTLEYIWRRYVENHKHCEGIEYCGYRRLHIRIDIHERYPRNEVELYNETIELINHDIQTLLKTLDYEHKYAEFVSDLFEKRANGVNIPFLATLAKSGISKGVGTPPSIQTLVKTVPNDPRHRRDLALFVLRFGGWLRSAYCRNLSLCAHLIYDNVDTVPPSVQEAIIRLMESTNPQNSMLIILACRPETFVNYRHRCRIADVIPHMGPTAYKVVRRRISTYLSSNPEPQALSSKLQGLTTPEDFLKNLALIKDTLARPHFTHLFDNLFGYQIRAALVMAQGIVDLAAAIPKDELEETVRSKSAYALERLLYLPWGLRVPKIYAVNVFEQGASRRDRLGALRTLIFLDSNVEGSLSVQDVCSHLSLFGYNQARSIGLLNKMMFNRLILARSQERLKLMPFSKTRREPVAVTKVGMGILTQAFELSYVESMMYFSTCERSRYMQAIGIEPDLAATFSTLREFLKETAGLEVQELRTTKKKKQLSSYSKIYGHKSLTQGLYESIIPTLTRIGRSSRRRRMNPEYVMSLLNTARNFLSDFNTHCEIIRNTLGCDPEVDSAIVKAERDIGSLDMELKSEILQALQ